MVQFFFYFFFRRVGTWKRRGRERGMIMEEDFEKARVSVFFEVI